MATLAQLEAYTGELAAAVKSFASHCADVESPTEATGRKTSQSSKAYRTRRVILAQVNKIQTLLSGPADFLQTLAAQNQLLACLQWLGEFQVLACIPLHGSVPISDVAELAGVPEIQLCRIIQMTATAGFLQESQPGQVAHTALSARFVTKPSYLDAAMFLAETAAPAALQMAAATQRFGPSQQPNESAYNIAFHTSDTFASSCEQRPHLQRQWPAYLRLVQNLLKEQSS
ncbi:hypothetical protein BBP40_007847 [Aspergillus hancockii]|nr:hypothetical protein BBP40_007847 [Aspergillus hancockii]